MIITEENKREILWNIINSFIAFLISFFSILIATDFIFTFKGFVIAFSTGMITAVIKFREYWESEKGEYSNKLLTFI